MTYKNTPPAIVFERWKELNPDYMIDFSMDHDCISFLRKEFNEDIANLFINIKEGMYKADLWRLCKLYINGGVYCDVDLVPYVSIDKMIETGYDFYSCMASNKESIFQALIITKPYNPLLLQFIMSFIIFKPYIQFNGPTYDMYRNIMLLNNNIKLESEKVIEINNVMIPINMGTHNENIKIIKTPFNIPTNSKLIIKEHNFCDTFNILFVDNNIIVQRTDSNSGWGYNHTMYIVIPYEQSIFLFTEKIDTDDWKDAYIMYNGIKILDCRDKIYCDAKISNTEWS